MAFTVRCPLDPPTAPGIVANTQADLATAVDAHLRLPHAQPRLPDGSAPAAGTSNWALWYVPLNCHS